MRSLMTLMVRLLFCLLCLGAALLPEAHGAAKRAPRNDALAQCSWDRPGRNAFIGDVVAAVDRYSDIPTLVRVRLKERMQAREYDDMVDIRRDSIQGKFEYASAIRDMHFGKDRVCRQVTRSKWTDKTHERGLVYCESEHCILVPTVCRNVSRIDRKPPLVAGDTLKPPPGLPTAPDVASAGRDSAAGAGAPQTPPAPVTSSFSEAVAGAAVPLFGPIGDTPLAAGLPPAGVIAVPGADSSDTFAPGELPFPPLLFVPGGGGGGPGSVSVPGGGPIGGWRPLSGAAIGTSSCQARCHVHLFADGAVNRAPLSGVARRALSHYIKAPISQPRPRYRSGPSGRPVVLHGARRQWAPPGRLKAAQTVPARLRVGALPSAVRSK